MSTFIFPFKMIYQLSGLILLLLDSSLICGQTTQKNSVAFEGQTTQKNSVAFEDSNGTYEDQEDFQDQELYHHYVHCDDAVMMEIGEKNCCVNFNASMTELGVENWCNVEKIVSYHELTECLERTSRVARCYYPNRVVEQLFVAIHQRHFHSCSDEEELPDAPAGVVLAATLLPIILIPFIVYVVVWKSSLRD
ncbi:receptor activity-modifying protein 3-like isoform X2 [Triplophysa rosa]|uniref:receptor activity-modifying protein 3-like isoform X2 n=1 Tax=Triplophysa rosa TaxID=992332 RepID=UPI002545F7DE|nr:receptor activity-modifying protein 3-like isoform X2 [Triplophysa rosa]